MPNGWEYFLKLRRENKVKFLKNFELCPFNDSKTDIMGIFDKDYPDFKSVCRDAFVIAEEGWDYWDEIKIEL